MNHGKVSRLPEDAHSGKGEGALLVGDLQGRDGAARVLLAEFMYSLVHHSPSMNTMQSCGCNYMVTSYLPDLHSRLSTDEHPPQTGADCGSYPSPWLLDSRQ